MAYYYESMFFEFLSNYCETNRTIMSKESVGLNTPDYLVPKPFIQTAYFVKGITHVRS